MKTWEKLIGVMWLIVGAGTLSLGYKAHAGQSDLLGGKAFGVLAVAVAIDSSPYEDVSSRASNCHAAAGPPRWRAPELGQGFSTPAGSENARLGREWARVGKSVSRPARRGTGARP